MMHVFVATQTPNSPIAAGSSGGRKASQQIILVCHGATQGNNEVGCLDLCSQLNSNIHCMFT